MTLRYRYTVVNDPARGLAGSWSGVPYSGDARVEGQYGVFATSPSSDALMLSAMTRPIPPGWVECPPPKRVVEHARYRVQSSYREGAGGRVVVTEDLVADPHGPFQSSLLSNGYHAPVLETRSAITSVHYATAPRRMSAPPATVLTFAGSGYSQPAVEAASSVLLDNGLLLNPLHVEHPVEPVKGSRRSWLRRGPELPPDLLVHTVTASFSGPVLVSPTTSAEGLTLLSFERSMPWRLANLLASCLESCEMVTSSLRLLAARKSAMLLSGLPPWVAGRW